MKVCGRLCVMCMSFVSLSPHFLHFSLSLSACVHTMCEMLGWWKLQGTGPAVSWSTLDKARDTQNNATIEYLQHTEFWSAA